jgi:hypothetical protein
MARVYADGFDHVAGGRQSGPAFVPIAAVPVGGLPWFRAAELIVYMAPAPRPRVRVSLGAFVDGFSTAIREASERFAMAFGGLAVAGRRAGEAVEAFGAAWRKVPIDLPAIDPGCHRSAVIRPARGFPRARLYCDRPYRHRGQCSCRGVEFQPDPGPR